VPAAVEGAGAAGVAHADALVGFATAVVRGDGAALERARDELLRRVGPAGVVDAAAVVGNFEMMDRIADATGIPVDGVLGAAAGSVQRALHMERFASAANTPRRLALRLLGPVLEPLMRRALRAMGPRMGRRAGS
jgi:hypothetical protein